MSRRPVIDFESAFQRWKIRSRRSGGDDVLILDLGQHSLNALYAKIERDGAVGAVDYAATVDSGLSEGAVTDEAKFAAAVERVATVLRRRNRLRTRRLQVSLSSPFISYFNHFVTVNLSPRRRVTQGLIDESIERAGDEISCLVEHVMQVVPVRYTLDSIYSGGGPPLGMRGQQLGIELFFLTAPEAALERIEKALKGCGYSVDGWWYAGLSAADSVMLPAAEAGVAVVDVGGATTDVAVFRNGRLLHVGVIRCGGRDFDSDLSTFLNEGLKVAEEVKRLFGCALPQVIRHNEVVDLRERGLGADKLVSAREIAGVIRDRARELSYMVEEEIGKAISPALLSRVVLTGGGAKLEGLAELAEIALERSVEVGAPRAVNGTRMGFSDPGCAALVGTLRLLRRRLLARRRVEPAGMSAGDRLRSWFGALVGSPVAERKEAV